MGLKRAAKRKVGLGEALAISGILLVAAAFRLVLLNHLPPGLHQDEAVYAVDAESIFNVAPRLYYGEREPLFMYLQLPFLLILGPTPIALRATAAFVGIVVVAAGGALGRQLFGRTIGLLTAAGLATSLWMTVLSRVGYRAITYPAVECLGLALLWRATKTGRRRDYVVAGVVLGLSLYSYLASRFLPVALFIFLGVCLIWQRVWLREHLSGLFIAGVVAVVVCLPLGTYGLAHPDMFYGRPDQVALPSGSAYLPALIKSTVRTLGMVVVHGDENWRQNLSGAPVFDPLDGLIFFVGLVLALIRPRPSTLLVLVLLIVSLVPGMLSVDSPHYLRTEGAAVAMYSLWALGLVAISRVPSALKRVRLPSSIVVWGAPAIIALGLAGSTIRTGWDYFVVYARSPEVPAAFNADLAAAGRFLAATPLWRTNRDNVYVTDHFEVDHTTIAYFLYPFLPLPEKINWVDDGTVGTFFDQDGLIPLPVGRSVYIVSGDDPTVQQVLGPAVTQVIPIPVEGNRTEHAILADPTPANLGTGNSSAGTLAQLGSWLSLESTNVEPPTTSDPSTATVVLRWRILARPTYQPSIFVHVEDGQHHLIVQADQETSLVLSAWRPGQEIVSLHAIHLPPGTPPGTYPVTVGVYDKASGRREAATVKGQAVAEVSAQSIVVAQPIAGAVTNSQSLNRLAAPGLQLLGTDGAPSQVDAGTSIPVTLVWQASDNARANYNVDLTLHLADDTDIAEWLGPIGSQSFPTGSWAPNTTIRQTYDVPVPATASGPVALSVTVRPEAGSRLLGSSALPRIDIAVLTIKASNHNFQAPQPQYPASVQFGDVGTLVGYDLAGGPTFHVGSPVTVTLHWQAIGPSVTPYTVFVHLLDAHDQIVGQRDEGPVHGDRPTTSWVPREYISDPHAFSINPGTPAGVYRLEVGLYDPQTGKRVATTPSGDHAIIGTLMVGSP